MKETEYTIDDLPEDDFPPLTARERSRLQRFQHLTQQIRTFQPLVDAGRNLHWGPVNEQGKVVMTHLIIDQRQLDRLRRLAYGIYESDLARKEHTRDIAEDILADQDVAAPMTKRRFSELWETD